MKLKSLFLLLLLFASALLLTRFLVMPATPVPPEVTTDSATLRNLQDGNLIGFQAAAGSDAWLGIPYARPPIGDLRWRAPQPPEAWQGTREGLQFSSPCPQFGSMVGGVSGADGQLIGSEDCLYLNIWAPRFPNNEIPAAGRGVPVMLWIHGGGNTIGHGGFYDGSKLAARHNVIVITFNYRLGPLGWFRHPSLQTADATPLDQSGNYGTLDMVRALEWVQKNISLFGGNPNNVTVFGESAGGRNVFSLLISPTAAGLFHRAIVQSGGTHTTAAARADNYLDDEVAGDPNGGREILLKLLMRTGKSATRDGAKTHAVAMSNEAIEQYLRGLSVQQLFHAYSEGAGIGMFRMPQLFRDGEVLPEADTLTLFAQGKYHKVPIMLGTNRDENKLFFALNPEFVSRYLGVFFHVKDPIRYDMLSEYHSQTWKLRGVDRPAALLRIHQEDVFAYRFDWDEEPVLLGNDFSKIFGAAHGFEIPFVFNHFYIGPSSGFMFDRSNYANRRVLSDSMMSYWVEFAYNGSPGTGRAGEQLLWAGWDEGNNKFIVLDTPADGGIRMSNDNVTLDSLVEQLKNDERLVSQRARCELYAELFKGTEDWNAEIYRTLNSVGCGE